ncbi:ankyrin repeat-containing protein [Cavenderia fasciculata]|uniref:Ankyrin repeat-containing protein n=1 Tax=Cavenderia fasciculata TaxID=261658 RepID=F4Q1G4_CACFS|nr:ankyrin repeat-containing protein [Cavenderia fasciculata]EGG18665.1 ankyrin repeat-containing protein [Cavenderia fasciculata]|eukprot:XP_004366569.1 ankyrin repeat-containing protein [Cavenderia fasciculata]
MNLVIKCKICRSFESRSIDEFRLHGINHCIPSVTTYFGLTLEQILLEQQRDNNDDRMQEEEEEEDNQQQQQQDIVKMRKRDHNNKDKDNNNNNNTITTTTKSIRFKSLIGSPFIRRTLFKHVKELSNLYKISKSGGGSHSGKDIIKLPHLGMISLFAMPWEFIKHYLPNKDNVLLQRRMIVISQYCAHRNATLDTLLKLLEWSPEYDPQDQFDSAHHQNLFYNVSAQGHRDILELLLKRYPNISTNGNRRAMDIASEYGHLSTVQLLSSVKTVICTPDAMRDAAENGHYEIVKYLDETRTEGCSTHAMDSAAYYGHFNIVRYLNCHRLEGCTSDAMDGAALNGHLNILQYLHQNRYEGCTIDAMNGAALNGHLNILQWLRNNRTEGCSTNAMDNAKSLEIVKFLHVNGKTCTTLAIDNACLKGDLDIVQFLFENRTEGCTQHAIINDCKSGNFDLIKFLLNARNQVCTPEAVDSAIKKKCSLEIIKYLDKECTINGLKHTFKNDRLDTLDLIQYLYQRFPKTTNTWDALTFDLAAVAGKLDIVKFLHENKKACTIKTMDHAAEFGNLDIVQFLHFNRTEGCTIQAMDISKNLEVIKFLHFNRTEGCTTKCMDNAARRGDIETVEWLHKNRTEGCTDQALWESNNPDIYNYILSNKIIPLESIKQGNILTLPYEEDYYELI